MSTTHAPVANPDDATTTAHGGGGDPVSGEPWADMSNSKPFDIDDVAGELGEPKQHYPGATEAGPEPTPIEEGGEVAEGTTELRRRTRYNSAKAIIGLIDQVQSNAFAVFAGNNDPQAFKMPKAERDDTVAAMADGMPENWRMPWYVPLLFTLAVVVFNNYRRMQAIRKERREAEAKTAREAAAKAQAESNRGPLNTAAPMTDAQVQAVKVRRARRSTPAVPSPARAKAATITKADAVKA